MPQFCLSDAVILPVCRNYAAVSVMLAPSEGKYLKAPLEIRQNTQNHGISARNYAKAAKRHHDYKFIIPHFYQQPQKCVLP
jgi:hypothetical protein